MTEAASALRLREVAAFQEILATPVNANTLREAMPGKHEEWPANGQAVLIEGLSKSFGDRRVLSKLDLAIPAGQLLAIVGRSGCGKSTLLRLIAGLDRPNSGTISVGERSGAFAPIECAASVPGRKAASLASCSRQCRDRTSVWLARNRHGSARRCWACGSCKRLACRLIGRSEPARCPCSCVGESARRSSPR